MPFHQKLKALRKNAGLSQKQLSMMLKVALSTVAMWETANREPNIATLKKIAEFFNVSIEVLLNDDVSIYDRTEVYKVDKAGQPVAHALYDEEILDLRHMLHSRPEMKMLFSVSKGASKEDVERAVAIIEALKKAGNSQE